MINVENQTIFFLPDLLFQNLLEIDLMIFLKKLIHHQDSLQIPLRRSI